MTLVELDHALRQLRLSGMARVLEVRLRQAQTERLPPLDLVSALVADELLCRQDRLLDRRTKQARFRDPDRSLDRFDFDFNKKMNRALIHDLATGRFIQQREDALFLGPPGTGKSHLAQAIGRAAIQQGYRVWYREAHQLLEDLADATLADTKKTLVAELTTVPLLIIDDLGMRKLPHTAAEDLLEIIMRRYERASTLLTSNLLCGEPHNRFNAERSIMRSLGGRGPVNVSPRRYRAPHNGAASQEGDQLVGGFEAAGAQVGGNHRFERFEFHGRVSARVHLGRLHVRVSEPERDLTQVLGRLEHRQGAGVPQNVRRDVLRRQGRARAGSDLDMLVEDVLEPRPRQRLAARTDEHLRRWRRSPADRQPRPQCGGRDFPQGQATLTSTFAVHEDRRLRLQRHVTEL